MMANNDTLIREVNDTYLGKSIISSKEAREYLSISESMLDKLCQKRIIPYTKPTTVNQAGEVVDGRKRYYKVSDLNKWLNSNYHEAI